MGTLPPTTASPSPASPPMSCKFLPPCPRTRALPAKSPPLGETEARQGQARIWVPRGATQGFGYPAGAGTPPRQLRGCPMHCIEALLGGGNFPFPGASRTHLEGLEGEAHVEALGDGDLPDAHLAGPVVVGVVGGLDVPVVLLHVPPADGCKGRRGPPPRHELPRPAAAPGGPRNPLPYLRRRRKSLCPPSCCCCGTRPRGGCRWRRWARAACSRRTCLGTKACWAAAAARPPPAHPGGPGPLRGGNGPPPQKNCFFPTLSDAFWGVSRKWVVSRGSGMPTLGLGNVQLLAGRCLA